VHVEVKEFRSRRQWLSFVHVAVGLQKDWQIGDGELKTPPVFRLGVQLGHID
jgi:hypothetical protein